MTVQAQTDPPHPIRTTRTMAVVALLALLALLAMLGSLGVASAVHAAAANAAAAPAAAADDSTAAPSRTGSERAERESRGQLTAHDNARASGAESSPLVAPASWVSGITQQIADEEYEITWQEETALPGLDRAYQAPNRAHGLRTYFTEQGVRVVPRVEAEAPWELGLVLIAAGRAGAVAPVPPAALRSEKNRMTYDRGDLHEWYLNDAKGLEQGFTLLASPPRPESEGETGTGETGETLSHAVRWPDSTTVVLELALEGTLSAFPTEDGQSIAFRRADGTAVLRYAGLRVTDASGTELPAVMKTFAGAEGRRIRLLFSDAGASYPVTVDPLTTAYSWLGQGDQVDSGFGISVMTAGDVNGDGYSDVIVGASKYDNGQANEGRAYVFHGSASGLAVTAAWTRESNEVNARFGISVSTAGDANGDGYSDVVVGGNLCDSSGSFVDDGCVWFYRGSGPGLGSAIWVTGGQQSSAFYGTHVATAGDVNGDGFSDVLIGAINHDNGQTDEGRAYLYLGQAAFPYLGSTPAWTAEGNQAGAMFGVVATAGDVNRDGYSDVIVGAPLYDRSSSPPESDDGRAFLYLGSASGLSVGSSWTTAAYSDFDHTGISVGTAGDVNGDGYADVLVGASGYDNGQLEEGRMLVYHGSASGLNDPITSREGNQDGAEFGISVGTAGDVNGDGYADVIAGAHLYDGTMTDEGRAFIYLGSSSGLIFLPEWTVDGGQSGGAYGYSVATAGDVDGDGFSDWIVGARLYDNGQTDEGLAFVYHGSPSGPPAGPGWTIDSNQIDARFGSSVASAGDVNGDGYSDVVIGTPFYDNGQTDEGRASLYHGSPSGLSIFTPPAWTAEGNQAGARFGGVVAAAGDVNGDGFSDVAVGAGEYDNTVSDEGRALVYLGSSSGLGLAPAWTRDGGQAGARFGSAAATAGDVNGDGFSDLIVGASQHDNGQTDEGRAFVYLGSVIGPAAAPAWTAESNQAAALFGGSVATAGDVNRDGFSDVVVGASQYDNGQTDEGRVFLYLGSAAGPGAASAWTAEGNQAGARFGTAAASAGDVNGDGYSDIVVGASQYDNGQTDEGAAFVYLGQGAGPGPVPLWIGEIDQTGSSYGAAVATAGDVNGDGYSDLVVGAPAHDFLETNEGGAFVYLGSIGGPGAFPLTIKGGTANASLGASVGTAGDVDGDGYADLIAGAPFKSLGQTAEGVASLYYGNGGHGVRVKPDQRRPSDAAPVAPLGASDETSAFRLSAIGRSPFGRGPVRLEWEVKPLGAAFDGAGTTIDAGFTDSGSAGALLSRVVGGGATDTAYHWRLRVHYNRAVTPFLQRSRWFTAPSNGWNEADLRTAAVAAGRVPDGAQGLPLRVTKAPASNITLDWEPSCNPSDTDYAIYRGTLEQFYSHQPLFCSTSGATSKTFAPGGGNSYYLVVPLGPMREGSYGTRSGGIERPPAIGSCMRQAAPVCP